MTVHPWPIAALPEALTQPERLTLYACRPREIAVLMRDRDDARGPQRVSEVHRTKQYELSSIPLVRTPHFPMQSREPADLLPRVKESWCLLVPIESTSIAISRNRDVILVRILNLMQAQRVPEKGLSTKPWLDRQKPQTVAFSWTSFWIFAFRLLHFIFQCDVFWFLSRCE